MLQIDKDNKINAEALKSMLLRQGIIRPRFRMPYTEEQVRDMLAASMEIEVYSRHQSYRQSQMMDGYIAHAAKWLTAQSSKFGLMLCGLTGNGKTTLTKAIISLVRLCNIKDEYSGDVWSCRFEDAKDLMRVYRDKYENFKHIRSRPMLAIDDLGCEPAEVLDYGTATTPIIDLLCYRYSEQLFTIVTTNLTGKQIREKYGDRIADRFNEMMDVIIFENGSYRGQDAQK